VPTLGRARSRPTRILFASDIHGSDVTFRKFVRAARFYDVDVLVFGGDLMGKAFVPIVRDAGGSYHARFEGRDHVLDHEVLERFRNDVERAGFYSKVMDPEEYEGASEDPFAQRTLFVEAARERLAAWLAHAEDRLAGTDVRLYLTGGNDDEPAVLEVLEAHDGAHAVACEGHVVDLDGEHTMVTVGWSTPTPWDTPREADEGRMATMIEAEIVKVPDVSRTVFNFHCPPKDTPIDTCLLVESAAGLGPGEMPGPVRTGGRFHYTGGGSMAVRDAVKAYQPAVALHGHIHESGGRFRLGRTQCFNPGSEYLQGTLRGWIVALKAGTLTGYQHTSG
jgi:Icc-related predicted phosphoesterase